MAAAIGSPGQLLALPVPGTAGPARLTRATEMTCCSGVTLELVQLRSAVWPGPALSTSLGHRQLFCKARPFQGILTVIQPS